MVCGQARKQVAGRVYTQGIGRQPRQEVVGACLKIIDAFAEQLGDKKYFCGDRPTTYDATTYAFGAGILCPAFDNELLKHSRSKKNLASYVDRLEKQYWKE
jgi:glutathione S-transferase